MKISAFTLGYNLIESGYPFVEAISTVLPYVDEIVAVDVSSTDGTFEVLQQITHKAVQIKWEGEGDQVLKNAFNLHSELCSGDLIIFFEADEVFDETLLSTILWQVDLGYQDLGFYRIQVEANFQRVRWYPHSVYRVFKPGTVEYYPPHPVQCPEEIPVIPVQAGMLWDCSNIFKDSWNIRKENQSKLWTHNRQLSVSEHFALSNEISPDFNAPYWEFDETPLKIPFKLKKWLGVPKYKVEI